MIAACPVAFGEVGVKSRIKSVLNYKKPALWLIIISLVIAVYLLVQSIINLVEVFEILLEKVPEDFSVADYKNALSEIEGVSDIHHLHVWTFEGEKIMATVHVRIPDDADMRFYKEVKRNIEKLSWELGIDHLTVQLDVDECKNHHCDAHK